MILDALTQLSSGQAVTVTAPSTGVYDTAGVGVGNAVNMIFGVQNTVFGEDIGTGGANAEGPQLAVQVGTAFTAGGSATLQVQFQGAIDNGSNQPGTWQTLEQTDAIAVALLTPGRFLMRNSVPERYPGQGFPRFYRYNYVVATGPMTAGTLNANIITGIDSLPEYPSGF